MKPAVLCINRSALSQQGISCEKSNGIYPFELAQVTEDQYHFINRNVCDSDNPKYHQIGCELPQILAYCVIRCGNEILTYSRKKGAETRLHGSRSIGFGGHVDITDFRPHKADRYERVLIDACERELQEELNLATLIQPDSFNQIIVDQTNPVGSVHVGLPVLIGLKSKDDITTDLNEISDPIWLSIDELKANIDEYENWSKLLIKQL